MEKITVACERRHGMAHLSEFISLEELVDKTAKASSEATEIPTSKSLIRFQFAHRNLMQNPHLTLQENLMYSIKFNGTNFALIIKLIIFATLNSDILKKWQKK